MSCCETEQNSLLTFCLYLCNACPYLKHYAREIMFWTDPQFLFWNLLTRWSSLCARFLGTNRGPLMLESTVFAHTFWYQNLAHKTGAKWGPRNGPKITFLFLFYMPTRWFSFCARFLGTNRGSIMGESTVFSHNFWSPILAEKKEQCDMVPKSPFCAYFFILFSGVNRCKWSLSTHLLAMVSATLVETASARRGPLMRWNT